ncbi:MAG: DUF2723 domain-containing protein [Endomicrobiales bacterium]|nr:DUF2723 domain-containing protein [Endomicrobiales bacterium]
MKTLLGALIFLSVFAVYLSTMTPSLTDDDSGELAAVGAVLGTAHSPGYPLYCMVSKLFAETFPFANYAYRVNLVSAFFIALAALVVFLFSGFIVKDAAVSAAVAMMFAFSKSVWSMANVTEVYGVAAFFLSVMLLVMFAGAGARVLPLYLASFVFGLGLLAHYTIGFSVFGLLLWAVFNKKELVLKRPAALLSAFLWAAAGFSAVMYIYIRAKAAPVVSWEEPDTLERFWQVVARFRYGTAALAQGGMPPLDPATIWRKTVFFVKMLSENFTVFGFLLFLFGVFVALKDKRTGWPVLLMLLALGPGFLLAANVGMDPGSAELLKRFFFLSVIVSLALIANGLGKIPEKAARVSLFIPVYLLFFNFGQMNHRNEYAFNDYAKNILRTLPEGSLLFCDRADEMEFCLGYYMFAENRRADTVIVDCNAGITRSIYGPGYYRIWGKPRLAIRKKVESEIIRKTERPVYYATFYPDMIDIPRYPEGLIFRAKPGGSSKFPWWETYALRKPQEKSMSARTKSLIISNYYIMSEYALGLGDAKKAEDFIAGLRAYDETKRWMPTVAYMFHKRGMLKEAKRYYEEADASGLEVPLIYTNLGVILESEGKSEEALAAYERSASLDPENPQVFFNIAVLYWRKGEWDRVIDNLEKVIALDPGNARARGYLEQARQK